MTGLEILDAQKEGTPSDESDLNSKRGKNVIQWGATGYYFVPNATQNIYEAVGTRH